jgi:hypothetical protein
MNSKFFKICSAIGISAAITLGDVDFDMNDISSIDSYTPSKFFEGIEKISTADELVNTLADLRMYSVASPAPAELGGIIGVGDAAEPGATSSETVKSSNATSPENTSTGPSASATNTTATPAATSPVSSPSATSTASNSTAKVTADPILDDKPNASASNSTEDDQAFGAGASASTPAASTSTNTTAKKTTTSSTTTNSTTEKCTETADGMNSCTGQSGQAESASANNTVRAINNVTIPEDDAATVSDTLTKNGTKENFTASANTTNTNNSTTKELVDAIKAGAVIPEASNVTVPILKTNETSDGAAIKEQAAKKPCPFDLPKVAKEPFDPNSPQDILPYPNKFPAAKNTSSRAEVNSSFGAPKLVPGLQK